MQFKALVLRGMFYIVLVTVIDSGSGGRTGMQLYEKTVQLKLPSAVGKSVTASLCKVWYNQLSVSRFKTHFCFSACYGKGGLEYSS